MGCRYDREQRLLSNCSELRPPFRVQTTPLIEPVSAGRDCRTGGYARFLKRQLSLPVSTMSQW